MSSPRSNLDGLEKLSTFAREKAMHEAMVEARKRKIAQRDAVSEDVIEYLESEFYIPELEGPIQLFPEQKAVLREMFRRKGRDFAYHTMVYSSIKKSAKCVTPDTLITLSNGYQRRADSIKPGESILAWSGQDYVADSVVATEFQSPQSVYRITTRRGRSLIVTGEHPLLIHGDHHPPSWGGRGPERLYYHWVKAKDLQIKDPVVIAQNYACDREIDANNFWLLGLYMGDGGQTRISSDCPEVIERVLHMFDLRYAGQYDYRLIGATDWLRRYGFLKGSSAKHKNFKTSHTKRIPPELVTYGRQAIFAFLSGYLDSDGTVANRLRKQPAIVWSSVHKELLQDCQSLLAAVGVNGTLFYSTVRYQGRVVPYWRLAVYGRSQISYLAANLDCSVPEKANRLRYWSEQHGIDRGWTANVYETDRVVSIEEQPATTTISIEVEHFHNFVANGIVTHNTAIAAGVAQWQAERIPLGEVYIMGNDLKQADSRLMRALQYSTSHNPRLKNRVTYSESNHKFKFPNGTFIESIPIDPEGESGMNPTAIIVTEAWGARTQKHVTMWTEAQLSPTPGRAGQTFRFVESYAGYAGEAPILEPLYYNGVENGQALPHIAPELYKRGGLIVYWNTRPYLPWQTGDYYRDQASVLIPSEYNRIHKNQWVHSENVFVEGPQWDACRGPLPEWTRFTPMVVAIDAAISNDTFGLVMVGRKGNIIMVHYVHNWQAEPGQHIDFNLPETEIRRLAKQHNILRFVYDPREMEDMSSRLRAEGLGAFREFPQGKDREIADKRLYDLIVTGRIRHEGQPVLREHILNANTESKSASRMRLIKRNEDAKIDLAVALSMAAHTALQVIPG